MIREGKRNVLGVLVDVVDYEAAIEAVLDAVRQQQGLSVCPLAVHGVVHGALNAEYRYCLNHLDLICPDGQPVRWALNLLHSADLRARVYGPELMLRICHAAAAEKLPIYLYGSSGEVLRRLVPRLQQDCPGLEVVGALPGLYRAMQETEQRVLVQNIRESGAAILFVGLGCPRQETFAHVLRDALSLPIITVGAAFDFHAGLVAQAPTWMQDHGLEWLYRLLCEPRRLWRRYLLLNPTYLGLLSLQLAGLKRFSPQGRPRRGPVDG